MKPNNISKSHQQFANDINDPKVLTNPEEFLGPNYEAVLNYWLWIDGLSEDQWETIEGRYLDFYDNQGSEWDRTTNEAIEASNETIGSKFADVAAGACWLVYATADEVYSEAACWTTLELIGMHKILEQQKPLTFLPMFLEAYYDQHL